MERIAKLVGCEVNVDEVGRAVYADAGGVGARLVGGMLITCADESEREAQDAFQRGFAEHLLPALKPGERSYFRLANLGGRYETGAARIAQDHYSVGNAGKGFGLLVVKINSHVSAEVQGSHYRFGKMKRYDTESIYCGALHAMMEGSELPFARELAATFRSRGLDRLAALADVKRVPFEFRSLFVALAGSCLQARRAVDDIVATRPAAPTLFFVIHSVILNKKQKDGEIVCGMHRIDWRAGGPTVDHLGLGDDPGGYRVRGRGRPLTIDDDSLAAGPTTREIEPPPDVGDGKGGRSA